MPFGKRLYLTLGFVALFALAGVAVAAASQHVLDGGSPPVQAQSCVDQEESDETTQSAVIEAMQEAIGGECDEQAEAGQGGEQTQPGTLDDGRDLLPQADITLEQAIAAAQSAATGPLGEVELEYVANTLVFEVDVGAQVVQVDASNGTVVSVNSDD